MKITMLVNNTGTDLRAWEPSILASLEASQAMPEDLADLLAVRLVVVNGETRAIVDWA